MSLFWANGGVISAVAAVVSVGLTIASVLVYQSAARFDRVGVVTEAEIIARRVDTRGDDDDHYITFQFDADARTVTREREVSRRYHRDVTLGDAVDIRYLPHDPREFETYIGEKRNNAIWAQVIAGLAGLISLATLWLMGGKLIGLFWLAASAIGRWRRLYRWWKPRTRVGRLAGVI